MTGETILTGALLVLPEAVVSGTAVLRGGRIAEVQPGRSAAAAAVDLAGDYLLPGIVDLHSDNLERQAQPRTTARWPSRSALMAHDAQCAVAGITTVLDALCVGYSPGFDDNRKRTFREGVADLEALAGTGLLRTEHLLHLRCEIAAADMPAMFDPVAEHPLVRMVSLMDHCPGFGQYADLEFYRMLRRRDGVDETAIERHIVAAQAERAQVRESNRRTVLGRMAERTIAVASHDDRTAEEVAENAAAGIRISEFPVSAEAATAARALGMQVVVGAPNLVRGGSHSGNVAVADLIARGAVDALASDYVPASLVEAAFACAAVGRIALPQAVGFITEHPARMVGLDDRGRIAPGQRADLVRVRLHEGLPVVREVWRAGDRVA
ncbi:MAG: alpha-D-ribose 1-methylphosphonate 5-triphosphate diphosphatase [Alphaproteobacteria bacterium]|nr:alpha-D-ribose 1-methylphosphonate 5-triphosphate diphosphatase [Alphaproteobacteria bacterium]